MKKWYKSKTLWLSIATVVTAVNQLLPVVGTVIAPALYPWLVLGIGVAAAVVRKYTVTGIE
jgi:hypothetical protein